MRSAKEEVHMGYLLGIVWIAVFGGFGIYMQRVRREQSTYRSFVGEVIATGVVDRKQQATLASGVDAIGEFYIRYQDQDDFVVGQRVECIWDGKDPSTAQQDLRPNQRLGIFVSFAFAAAMVVILLVR